MIRQLAGVDPETHNGSGRAILLPDEPAYLVPPAGGADGFDSAAAWLGSGFAGQVLIPNNW